MARPKGTTKHNWNKDQSDRVRKLAIIGCNDNHIAGIEKMAESTMKLLYAQELSEGRAKGIGAVANTAYSIAVSGKNPAMTMFFLKCRAHWKEVQQVEHTGEDGGVPVFKVIVQDYTKK